MKDIFILLVLLSTTLSIILLKKKESDTFLSIVAGLIVIVATTIAWDLSIESDLILSVIIILAILFLFFFIKPYLHRKRNKNKIALLIKEAESFFKRELNNDARKYYKDALYIATKHGYEDLEGSLLYELGIIYHLQNENVNSKTHIDNALSIFRRRNDLKNEGKALIAKADILERQCLYEDALYNAEKAQNTYKQIDYFDGVGIALELKAGIYKKQSEIQKSADHYNQSLNIFRETKNYRKIGYILMSLAGISLEHEMVEEALVLYQQAQKKFIECGHHMGISKSIFNTGNIFYAQQDIDKAYDYFNKALGVEGDLSESYKALIMVGISKCYICKGNYEEARQLIAKALAIMNDLDAYISQIHALIELGLVCVMKCEYEIALEYYNKALEISEKAARPRYQCEVYYRIGELYHVGKMRSEAILYLRKALVISQKLKLHHKTNDILERLDHIEKVL